MNNAPIGVFDSGVGGLTCVKELAKLLPHEDIVYLGDTARVPYGTRSKETIARYTSQDMEFLRGFNVKMILVACGTASSVIMSSPEFSGKTEPSYSGVVIPAAHAACAATKNGKIGVIATGATIRSGSYGKVIRSIAPGAKVVGKACPMFVPLVENGYVGKDCPPTRFFAEEYLECMKREQVDTLILGCTHYPHLADVISDIMGADVKLISSSAELARFAVKTLTFNDELAEREEAGRQQLYCTDSVELFSENVERFLGESFSGTVEKCSLNT
ncbi:glutamate racemase [Ruminococcus sp.]|uniref:glutamate racemase n=1 Tax=Ruminococcus sp. TaxID=41978 RepID=UPI0025EF152D|nr:glutamate racemase [Ruminococcus sp.]MBQ8965831.1 glutamate racemase [Ruminococcus sp.]